MSTYLIFAIWAYAWIGVIIAMWAFAITQPWNRKFRSWMPVVLVSGFAIMALIWPYTLWLTYRRALKNRKATQLAAKEAKEVLEQYYLTHRN